MTGFNEVETKALVMAVDMAEKRGLNEKTKVENKLEIGELRFERGIYAV